MQGVSAQKALFIKPHVGIQTSINHIIQKDLADPEFNIYKLHVNPEFGVQFYYDLNENWSYYGGFSFNRIKIDIGTGSFGNFKSIRRGLVRFPFGIQKKIKTFGLLEQSAKPLVVLNLKLNAGISFDYFPNNVSSDSILYNRNMKVKIIDTNTNPGFSVFAGATFQFFNFQKNHVQLSFLYSQGINRKLRAEIDYNINNQAYYAEIGTRSSFFAIQIAYPFKIISFSKN